MIAPIRLLVMVAVLLVASPVLAEPAQSLDQTALTELKAIRGHMEAQMASERAIANRLVQIRTLVLVLVISNLALAAAVFYSGRVRKGETAGVNCTASTEPERLRSKKVFRRWAVIQIICLAVVTIFLVSAALL